MSYAMQPPAAAPAPTTAPRRPVSVTSASVVLMLMAVVGLVYAIATLAIAPGTVDRFRAAASGANSVDVDGFVTVVWIGAALSAVLAVILFALFIVLALGLRRGSNAARIATWVVAGLGLLAGCATTATVGLERAGDPTEGSLSAALSAAYPSSWIPLNITLAIAQMLGYLLVGGLLLASPGTFFGRAPKALPPDPFAASGPGAPGAFAAPGYVPPGSSSAQGYGSSAQGYGAPGQAAPGSFSSAGYGAPGQAAPGSFLNPGHGATGQAAPGQGTLGQAAPGQAAPGQGAPGQSAPGEYPGGYSAPPPGYALPPTGGYPAPPTGGFGSPYPADGQSPAAPPGVAPTQAPPPGPDDEYWSRPSS